MSYWCYGLYKDRDGYAIVELFFEGKSNKPWGAANLDWKQYFTDFVWIVKDLYQQRKHMKRVLRKSDFIEYKLGKKYVKSK